MAGIKKRQHSLALFFVTFLSVKSYL